MKNLFFHPRVSAETRELLLHYSKVSPELGDLFWKELWDRIDYAREFPERNHFDATGLRRGNLERFPVHFLYKVFSDRIRITVIRHNRRRPSYGARRL